MLNFRKISLADKQTFETLSAENPLDSCERIFPVNFAYSANYGTEVADWNGGIAILKPNHGLLHYPLGKDASPDELVEYAGEARAANIGLNCIFDVPAYYRQKFPGVDRYFDVVINADDFDYIYNLGELYELKGPVLRKKRNHIKHVETQNPRWSSGEIDESNIKEARDFALSHAVDFEKTALLCAFDNFAAAGFSGIVLRDEESKIVGLAVFAKISPQMYDVIFEKSDKQTKGAAQMLVRLEARALLDRGAVFMNREEDLGLPNLRKAKKSLAPARMYERLSLIPKPL